jgi:nucleoside-diphosphate-sugar epimerase
MKVLVTGGAGYIGSVLTERLMDWNKPITLDTGDGRVSVHTSHGRPMVKQLTVVDNMARGQNTLGRFCNDPRFRFFKADILSAPQLMEELYMDADVIIPLAGIVGAPQCKYKSYQAWALNHAAVVDMMMDVSGRGVKVVYPCTNSGYGSRPDGTPVTEEDELNPLSTYGQSKVKAEGKVLQFGGVSLRLATVMGWSPCMRLDLLVNDFTWQARKNRNIVLFEKNMKRNYIHVNDAADAMLLTLTNYDKMKGQAFNLGNSEANMSKLELAETIAKHTECHIVEAEFAEDPDRRDYLVSNQKIESLGFKPRWSLDDTVKQLIRFYDTVTLDSSNLFFDNWN